MGKHAAPINIHPCVAAAVGRSSAEKLSLIEHVLDDLCKHMEKRGYSFENEADGPANFFARDTEGAAAASELLRGLLRIIWAEKVVDGMGLMAPTNIAGKKQNFRNN